MDQFRKRVRYGADRCLVFASTTDARRFYHSFSPDQQRRLKALCRSMPPQPVVASLSPNVVVAALQRGQLQVYLPRGPETAGISELRAAIGQVLVDIFAHENTETYDDPLAAVDTEIKNAYDAVPIEERMDNSHGYCSEVPALQKAVSNGADLDDAISISAEVKTGRLIKACDSCHPVLKSLGMRDGVRLMQEAT